MKGTNKLIMLAILGCSIFGFEFYFVAQALDQIAPVPLLAYRFLLAALTLAVLKYTGVITVQLRKAGFGKLVVLSILQPGIYFILETLGIQMTSVTVAGIMMATIPVLVMVFAIFLLKEYPGVNQLISALVSISGLILITVMTKSEGSGNSFLGVVLLLFAILIYVYYGICVRKLAGIFSAVEVTYMMMWFGAVMFNGFALFQSLTTHSLADYFTPLLQGRVVISILYLGIGSTLAFFISNYLFANLGPSKTGIFANVTTIITILAGTLLRHDHFYWYHMVGTVLIILGVYGCVGVQERDASKVSQA